MQAIMNWVKEFILLYLLLTILTHLSAADQYKKYLRFFSGMILLLMLLKPAMNLFGNEGRLEALISSEIFWEQLDSIRQDTQKLEFAQNDHYRKKYEKAIAKDMLEQAAARGLPVRDIQASLTQDYEISRITVYLDAAKGQDSQDAEETITDFLQETYALEENQIFIS